MPFVYPGLAALGVLALVPVVIHLLNRRRYRPVRWAAMSFLLASIREDARKIQHRDLLLMLLRALACLLVALGVARPLTRGAKDGATTARRGVIVVMDTSLSMGAGGGAGTVMDTAKQEAIAMLRGLEVGTEVGLLDGTGPVATVIPRAEDRGMVESAIEEFTVRDGALDVAGSLRTAAGLAADAGYRHGVDVIFVTDLQASAWEREAESAASLIRGFQRDIKVYVVRAGEEARDNVAIASIETDSPWITQGQPAAVRVEVANGGLSAADELVVDLLVDGEKIASERVASLAPAKSETLTFVAELAALGDHVLAAVVNGAATRLPADDTRRTLVRVTSGVQVLLVDGEPGARFGEGEVDYLEALLNPLMGESGGAGDEPGRRAGFAVTRVAAEDLTAASLQDKAVIVLANVASLDPGTAGALEKRVAEGAGVVLFLGDQVIPDNYNQFFGGAATGGASVATSGIALLPAAVRGAIDRSSGQDPLRLSAERLTHPWMSLFRPKQNRPWLRSAIRKAYALDAAGAKGAAVVAALEDGTPLIVEKPIGEGRVVLVGTSADPEWNDFFVEPLGPILFRRVLTGIIPGGHVARTREVGEWIHLPLREEDSTATLKLAQPDGKLREVRAERVGDRLTVAWLEKARAGLYELRVEGPRPREERFVLNPPARESFIRSLEPVALNELFPGREIAVLGAPGAVSAGTLDSTLSRARRGRELWWPALLLAGLVLIAEIVLARLFTAELATESDLPAVARQALYRSAMGARPGGRVKR